MSPRPGRITDVIDSPLPRDRPLDIRDTPAFLEVAHRVREGPARRDGRRDGGGVTGLPLLALGVAVAIFLAAATCLKLHVVGGGWLPLAAALCLYGAGELDHHDPDARRRPGAGDVALGGHPARRGERHRGRGVPRDDAAGAARRAGARRRGDLADRTRAAVDDMTDAPVSAPGAAIGRTLRASAVARRLGGTAGPVLAVVAGLLALWYLACVPMNAAGSITAAERAGAAFAGPGVGTAGHGRGGADRDGAGRRARRGLRAGAAAPARPASGGGGAVGRARRGRGSRPSAA